MKALAASLLIAICASACNSPDTVRRPVVIPGDMGATQALNQVVCLDTDLIMDRDGYDPFLIVERHGSNQTPSGTLAVWASLASRAEAPLQLEARTTFYDEAGAPVDSGGTAWQRMYLGALANETYRASSLSQLAAQYYVEIRRAR